MSSSRNVRRSNNSKKRESSSNVTCSRCGVVQTVKSIKRHYPQCSGSSNNLRTSFKNDMLDSSNGPDDLQFDPMVDDLSEPEMNPDFVRRHLSVESQILLADSDYNDDDSDQSSDHTFTMDDPDSGSELGVKDAITDELFPGLSPPSILESTNNPASLADPAYQPAVTDDFTVNTNGAPLGSTEVSIELEVAEKYNHKHFSRQEQSMANLLSLFSSTGCRLGLFDDVLAHIKKDVKLGHLDLEKVSTRETFLSRLRLKFPDIAITSTDVHFPQKKGHPPRKFTVFVFDLLAQLQDMLDDFTVYGNVNKLNVNTDQKNWFHPKVCENPSDQYSEVMNSPWYQRTVLKMALNPLEDLLMPCALYHDFTGVDVYQKHSLGPWMIAILLPKTDVREKSSSWRHMFMIPDVGKGGKGLSSEEKNRLYHEGLRIGLEQLVHLQQNPPTMDVRVGGYKKRMRVHFVISLILGDQESSDKICARMPSHKNAVRLHRACLTSALHSSDASHSCTWVDPNHIKRLVKFIIEGENIILGHDESFNPGYIPSQSWSNFRDLCIHLRYNKMKMKDCLTFLKNKVKIARALLYKMYASYPVQNAFWLVDFGDNPFGVYRATVDDAMHFDELGKITYIAEAFLHPFSDTDSDKLDSLVEKVLSKHTLRSSARYHQPRLNYHRGFSRLTLLTASEHVGVLFACYVILHTSEGEELAKTVMSKQQEKYRLTESQSSSSPVNPEVTVNEQAAEEEDDEGGDANLEANVDRRISILDEDQPLPSSTVKDKKPLVFPDTQEAFSFVVNIVKRFQLHFVLDVALDPLQLGSVMRSIWKSIGHMFWKHRNDEEHLAKLFPGDRLHSPTLAHDLYNPIYHQQIMDGIFVLEDKQFWIDFLEYKKGTYRKQNQKTHGIDFIPKHGYVPNVTTADSKDIGGGKQKKTVGKNGKTSAILCDRVVDFKMFLEVCLGWHAFCHYSYLLEPHQRQNMAVLDVATRRMIEMFDQFVYRGHNTNDTRTCKCHSHLHSTHTYQEYGDPRQYNAGKGERGLKDWAKFPAKTAQKRDEATFLKQTTSRIKDVMLLDRSNRIFGYLFGDTRREEPADENLAAEELGPYRLRYKVPRWLFRLTDGECIFVNQRQNKYRFERVIDPYLLKWLRTENQMIDGDVLEIYTEICKDGFKEALRAHPHYTKRGEPWYDWAMIEWFNSETSTIQNVPGKLLLFYRVFGFDQVWALVHCCGYETFAEGMFESSKLISRHEHSFQQSSTHRSVPTLEQIMIESISHGVVGIEEVKEKKGKLNSILTSSIPLHKVIVIADRKTEWASKFMDWGEDLYNNGDCEHLCQAYIDPDEDKQCTGEEESLYLADSNSDDTTLVSNDSMNDSVESMSLSEVADLGIMGMDHNYS